MCTDLAILKNVPITFDVNYSDESVLKIVNDIKLLLCVSYNNNQGNRLFFYF